MKKISLLTKIIFHVSNIALIVLYLFPGSIIGWLLYNDFQKQPQISSNLIISFNHFCSECIIVSHFHCLPAKVRLASVAGFYESDEYHDYF